MYREGCFRLVLLRNLYLPKATEAINVREEPTDVKCGNSFFEDRQRVGIELRDCIEGGEVHAKSIFRAIIWRHLRDQNGRSCPWRRTGSNDAFLQHIPELLYYLSPQNIMDRIWRLPNGLSVPV